MISHTIVVFWGRVGPTTAVISHKKQEEPGLSSHALQVVVVELVYGQVVEVVRL